MTESDESVPEAEVPEYLADAAEPEEEPPSVPRTGVLRLAWHIKQAYRVARA